ncbi:MAG TPA: DNA repair protein RecN [Lachnospiraceae bacterium]|nr:DNA repair protein RecN [Lachnospiraceae bacterium]
MLANLHIKNLALIDELDIDFRDGLNILTGETGAGKSIIIGSIGIGLGGRFDTSLLRDDSKDGLVELIFIVDKHLSEELCKLDIEVPEDEVVISRRCTNGRTVNRINDSTVTLAKLKAVSERLISLHAQHEQRTLLKASRHLELVDSYSNEIPELKTKVSDLYHSYKEICDKLDGMSLNEQERVKRLDYIRYEINDIESARLTTGEDTELEALYKKASSAQEIAEIVSEIMQLVGNESDDSALGRISRSVRISQELTKLDEGAAKIVGTLIDIEGLANDFVAELERYASDMEFEPETLRETEERLNLINTLKSRYGRTIEDILESCEALKKEEEELASYDEVIADLKKKKIDIYNELKKNCDKLSKVRKETAKKLTADISEAMKELNFNDVRFDMAFEEVEPGANGADKAEFIISTNIGEQMRPLVDTASGGELSRIMLAIKSVVSEADDTPTLIFDEIDVGISGITAEKVGRMMQKLGEKRQVIAITHLPQIAAAADTSYVIEKEVVGEKTITGIKQLDEEGRVKELARLLGGENVSESIIKAAQDLLDKRKTNK